MVCGRGGISELFREGRIFGGLGMQVQPDGSSVSSIFDVSFTEEGKIAAKDTFEVGYRFEDSEAMNKFNSTTSAYQGVIGDRSGIK